MTDSLELSSVFQRYQNRFKQHYGYQTNEAQWSALNAIMGCRTEQYGKLALACSRCPWEIQQHRSCGHRACNQCQHNATSDWLKRQEQKRLPVKYYMVTFTLPKELRSLVKRHQKTAYDLLMRCAVETLKTFGKNKRGFKAEMAMTAVLHTHTRRLDYHPHVHIVVPAGGIHHARREWRKIKGKYLFNGRALAKRFRGAYLRALSDAGLSVPITPTKWIAQCKQVGHGLPALQYLSRYLYRGVISNKNIVSDDGTHVTFQYVESETGLTKTRTVKGEMFMALVLQHVLPKGFRRARDYGFLHGNAKKKLALIQLVLKVVTPTPEQRTKANFICKKCKGAMRLVGIHIPKRTIKVNPNIHLIPD